MLVSIESSSELLGHRTRNVRGYENRCIRVKVSVSRPRFPRLPSGNGRRRGIRREASEPIWPTSKRNYERRRRLHSGASQPNSFSRAHICPWKKSKKKKIITITSIYRAAGRGAARRGTSREPRTITSTRGAGTRHPSWIAFNPIRKKRVTNGLGNNKYGTCSGKKVRLWTVS